MSPVLYRREPGCLLKGFGIKHSPVRSGRFPVSTRQTYAAEVHVAGSTWRYRFQILIQNVNLHVGDWPANGRQTVSMPSGCTVPDVATTVHSVGPCILHHGKRQRRRRVMAQSIGSS